MCAAVNTSFTLPGQPATGTNQFIALGGDGFTSPKGMYLVKNFTSTGDAGGDENEILINMDPDYCCMIAFATVLVQPAAADREMRLVIVGDQVPLMVTAPLVNAISADIGGSQCSYTWMPPAFINPGGDGAPSLSARVANTLAEVLSLNAAIYIYDIRARESFPYAGLIAARGGSYESSSGL